MPGGFEFGPGASDTLGASDVRVKQEERAEAPGAAQNIVKASSSSATSASMAAPAPAVVDLVSDEESLSGDKNNENGDENDEKEQHRAHVNDGNGPLEGTASDQTTQRELDSPQPLSHAKSKPNEVVDLDLTNSPRRLSKGTLAKAKGKRQQHASAQWGALLTGSAKKKPTGIKDDSLLTAVAPVDTWGMVVDAKWRADFQSLPPMERNIQQTLKYMSLETSGPYTPAFALADGISEQAFRPPGSGSYAFDRLRSARSQHIAAPTWQLCAPNLHVAILAYLGMTARSLQGHLDPSVDELYQALAAMVQHETHRAESLGFRILAALFYSRTRWVSEDQLVERWRLAPLDEETNLADTVRELCRAGHVRSTPSNLADCLDMLQSCTRGLLLQLAPLQRCGLSSATKGQVMAYIAEKGINFARKLCSSISSRLVRLSDGTRGQLRRCMVHLFAHTGYSSEETRYLLRHVSLADLSFAGSPPSAVAFGNLAANLPLKQEQEQKSVGNAEATSCCLQRIQQREDYFKAVEFSGKLSLYAAQGDAGRAYRVLHEASSRLMRMLDGAESFQLRELHALARVCLTGCQLLERERRYADTEHYLRMIIQSTGHHKELVMVHCEALLRLVQDLIHRDAKTAALKLVEEALRQDAWVLGCALHPANESPNRLGGTGAALMGRCVRLSVPPRRWRLAIQDAARLNAPRLVHISAERANQVIGRQSSAGSAGGGSQTGKPVKASWETASTVEGVVLEHFQRHGGWSGIHCENGFGITVYTLIFWDIIFDLDAPHAERHSAFVEMPRAAADGTWLRYPATRQAVEARLAAIADEGTGRGLIRERVEAAWDRATATHARGVNLDRLSLQDTLFVLTGISLRAIAMICSLFAENYKAWNGGLPDLMLWRTQTNVVVIAKGEEKEISASSDGGEPQQQRQEQEQEVAETCFIEVKGPGDSLSDRQRAWIDKLTQAGADVSVCHVKAVAVSPART